MRAAILIVALTGCAMAPASGDLPSRAAVSEAIRQALACDASEDASCTEQPRRIIVHSLRCRPDATLEDRRRVLCRFSGTQVRRLHARPFGPECAWLVRDPTGIWRTDIWPDADVCDT
jgi:hypothetical protein